MRTVPSVLQQYDGARLMRRALLIWPLVRVINVVGAKGDWTPSPGAVVLMVLITSALCHVDARVMREPVFFANLGRPMWLPAAVAAAVVLVIEVLIAAVHAL